MQEEKIQNSKYQIGPKKWKNGGFVSGSTDLLKMISERTHLSEGEEAVREILREVYRQGKIRTKELAYVTKLPIPLVAAVRRELEKAGLLSRKGGAILTKEGENYVRKILGIRIVEKLVCPTCSGKRITIYKKYSRILKKLREYSRLRPKPFTWLDQAFGTPETAVLRALFMLEEGDVEGRNILFLGDDDLTSVATGLLRAAKRITVIDIDKRLLDLIENISRREKLKIQCIHYDLRKTLPNELINKYDVTFTDPPYTIQGLKLFISRGIEALRKRKCASVYLAFAHKPPDEMLKFQMAINEMGLFIRELIPRFNTYEGAGIFANTTFLGKLETTDKTCPSITRKFEGKMYSGEIFPTVRIYKCKCRKAIEVGISKNFSTIEELKSKGCPICGRKEGFKLFKKIRLKVEDR